MFSNTVINKKVFYPLEFSFKKEIEIKENFIPYELLRKIINICLNKDNYKMAMSLLLVNKEWYQITINHPFMYLANIITQLKSIDSFDFKNKISFKKIDCYEYEWNLKDSKLIQILDKESKGINRLLSLHSDFFEKIPSKIYKPFLKQVVWQYELMKISNNSSSYFRRISKIFEYISIIENIDEWIHQDEKIPIKVPFFEVEDFEILYRRIYTINRKLPRLSHLLSIFDLKNLRLCIFLIFSFPKILDDSSLSGEPINFWEKILEILNNSPSQNLLEVNVIVLRIVEQDGKMLNFVNKNLKKNEIISFTAVRSNGFALQFTSNSLKKNKTLVLEAVRQNGLALQFANDKLKKNKTIVLAAVRQNGMALRFANESLRKNQAIVQIAVQEDGLALQFVDDSLKKNKAIVLAAVQQDGWAFQFADKILRKDEEIGLAAVNRNGTALRFGSKSLRKNEEVALAAVKENRTALRFVDQIIKEKIFSAIT